MCMYVCNHSSVHDDDNSDDGDDIVIWSPRSD